MNPNDNQSAQRVEHQALRLALRVPQAAAALDVSECTIRRAVWSGALPACKIGGRIRILPADLERWLESHRIERA